MAENYDYYQAEPPVVLADDNDYEGEDNDGLMLALSAGADNFSFSMVDGCTDLEDLLHSEERHLDPSYVLAWHVRSD